MKFMLLVLGLFSLAAESKDYPTAGDSLLRRYNKADAIALVEILELENIEIPRDPELGNLQMQKQKVKLLKLWKAGSYKVGEVISGYSGLREKTGNRVLISIHAASELREIGYDKNALDIVIYGDEKNAVRYIGFLDKVSKEKDEGKRAKVARSYALKKIKEIEKKYKNNSSVNYDGEIRYWK